jgi:hypothetical protein
MNSPGNKGAAPSSTENSPEISGAAPGAPPAKCSPAEPASVLHSKFFQSKLSKGGSPPAAIAASSTPSVRGFLNIFLVVYFLGVPFFFTGVSAAESR